MLRHLLAASKKFGAQALRETHRKDLEMWSTFLHKVSTNGIDINNITFTEPTHTAFSDACKHGLGGYCSNGQAWRYKLPDEQVGQWSINLLEFLAATITIQMITLNTTGKVKILAFTDSSSALSWLYKASFGENQPIHDKVARRLALELIDNDSALYSQHIKGKHNVIADSLSRDHHMTN